MLTKKESYVWIILFLLLFSYLIEFLFFEFPAGWDLSPHYYIYSKAIQSLKNGMILTYDNNWYGGYPLFSLYPPGSYYFLGLLHFLSFGLISQELSFKLSYFLIPFLFIICIFYLTKSFFGKKSAYFSLFLTYLFLFSDIRYAHLNIGLGGQFYVGLLTSTISTIFMLVFFLQIRLYELYQKKINAFFCSLCLSIVIISNVITAIFTFWILTFFFIFKKKMRIFLIVIIVISFFITSYWWVNFLIHFQFSATNTIGLREDIISDPLLAIFQDIDTIKMLFLNYKDIININNDLIGQISLSRLLIDFPYLGILTLIGTFFSIVRLIKNKHFLLPTVFLISIIFLPRNFFNAIIDIPIHYYRFIYFISIISIILSAYGLRIFYHRMKVTRHKIIFSTTKITLAAFIIIGIIAKTISGVDWNREIVIDNISINPNYKFSAERYDTYHKTKKILNFFQEQNPQGRIAIEGSVYSMFYLGSPHLLSSIIPLKLDLEVFPGLLAESAQSSAFINPLLTIGSNHISWGRNNLLSNFDFLSSSHKEIIDRFRRFGTEYIIATSNTYIKNLDKAIGKELEVVLDLQDIKVYQLKTYIKKTLTSDYKPFFFIEDGGVSFFDFSEIWYSKFELLDNPIISSKKRIQDIPITDIKKMAGFILSVAPYSDYKKNKNYNYLKKYNKQVLVLKDINNNYASSSSKNYSIDETINFLLKNKNNTTWEDKDLKLIKHPKMQLIFSSNDSTLINYSFSPRWESLNKTQIVYQATPTSIFVFGKGNNILEYK